MSRPNISAHLIHFTKGVGLEGAYATLRKILSERRLVAGYRFIKGKHKCVCFSEAPLASLSNGLVNEDYYSKYSPFGIMVSKEWLFRQGGRPVIYQTESDYEELPISHQWRHVRYELRENFEWTDFTWEREWRIRLDELAFDPSVARIIVPSNEWAHRLERDHDYEDGFTVMQYSLVVGHEIAEAYRDAFEWTVLSLAPNQPAALC